MPGNVRLHRKLTPFPVFTCGALTTDSCLLCSRNLGVRASLEAARSAASAAKSALDARCSDRTFEAPGPWLDRRLPWPAASATEVDLVTACSNTEEQKPFGGDSMGSELCAMWHGLSKPTGCQN